MKIVNEFLELLDYLFFYSYSSFKIFTHLTIEEKIILYTLGRKEKTKFSFVEIGSYLGASANFLAAAIDRSKKNIDLFCVDTWQNDAMTEGKRDTWSEFSKNTNKFKDIIRPLKGDSSELGRTFDGKVSLLFIDGDHHYEGCYKDVVSWFPHVVNGGCLIFHDIGWAEGVQKVVAQLQEKDTITDLVIHKNICWAVKKQDVLFEE